MKSTGDSGAGNVRVICGPTAAGKSEIAFALALEYGCTIISADSRQIYRGFDIGTAKPSEAERAAVTYNGVDIANPTERYSASLWADAATAWIRDAGASGATPVIVGGTGFYIRSLFNPLFDAPLLDPNSRAALSQFLATLSTAEVRRWCSALDPSRSHLGRVQLERAVETALLTGERLSSMQSRPAPVAQFTPHYLVVDPGSGLGARIEARVDAMVTAGWQAEVRALIATSPPDAPAWNASGYEAMREVANGTLSLSSARERIIIETRQYAKRQRTWFRHQLGTAAITRINPDDANRTATVERWWKESA